MSQWQFKQYKTNWSDSSTMQKPQIIELQAHVLITVVIQKTIGGTNRLETKMTN